MTIEQELIQERKYQVSKWGTSADDLVNTPMDFVGYIAHHSTRWFSGGFRPYSKATLEEFRVQMVKVGALAIAAIEAVDKILQGTNSRPDVLEA